MIRALLVAGAVAALALPGTTIAQNPPPATAGAR